MRLVLSFLACVACGDHPATTDGAVDIGIDADPNNPQTLFDTGLCVDRACTQISPDVHSYAPRFALWADTASKRRWYKLPDGAQIDTSDMDHWVFPVGTKFWKEFSRDDGAGHDIRIETRLIQRIGPGDLQADWLYVPFQWNADETDTTAQPMGVMNANGTTHDIPSRSQCRGCHENLKPSRILGFQAIQLDFTATAPDVDLAGLVAAGTLTANPASAGILPYFPFDPAETTSQHDALGYLHANCGHCHNASSSVHDITTMVLRLDVATVGTKASTPTYTTAVGQPAQVLNVAVANYCPSGVGGKPCIINPTDPADSVMMFRFESVDPSKHMPALGSKVMDPTGDTLLTTWITTP